jgi:hypothetical protein
MTNLIKETKSKEVYCLTNNTNHNQTNHQANDQTIDQTINQTIKQSNNQTIKQTNKQLKTKHLLTVQTVPHFPFGR